ncbi:hypothetical protein H8B13_04045 [Hymenobacter sp. BT188]|uniref:hypothetical protein n=1 Tax=Hymenobacter sp. BT188 TaxID=2763504 RepID=UPI0016513930|nr:hypothetical protein [Hymenobacter sp. BT188]MBC6605982.1 hypothetical protein [Hymenobacter sp. BT188]
MKSRLLLLSSLLFWSLASSYTAAAQGPGQRQRYFSNQARPYYRGPFRVTVGGGVALYTGDLGKWSQNLPGPIISLGGLYLLRPRLQVGGEVSYFQLGATDQLPERNLAFRGRNGALTTFLRYELFGDESQFASPRGPAAILKPYIKAGVGLAMYHPKTYIGSGRPVNNQVYLAPESTGYPNVAVIAPVGGGLTFRLSRDFSATAEAVYNFTSTDKLDDVSLRGNTKKNDGYGTVELKIEYSIH